MRRATVFRAFAWLGVTAILAGGSINGCTDDLFRAPPALTASASDLKASIVAPALDVPIRAGQNVLWCATVQLAWDQACATLGGDLRLRPPEDPAVTALNRHPVRPADLDADAYVAVAGRVRDGIVGRIEGAMRDKFHGRAKPKLQPGDLAAGRPQDVLAYCYLFEKLDFPTPFERLDAPLQFAGTAVAAFGMDENKPGHDAMARGVSIVDYRTADDFVIDLQTKSPSDRITLAKVKPDATLAGTVAAVARRRAAASPTAANPDDVLTIPKMNFDVTRRFGEVTGRPLVAPAAAVADQMQILDIVQDVRFLMDEKGVELVSETNMSIGCSAPAMRRPTHRMVFDKPFLLLLSRVGGSAPYFAMWVDNAELLLAPPK